MKIETLIYSSEMQSWDCKTFPAMDSENTLIIIFGAAEYYNNADPIQQLISAYPESIVIGCSTAGEIDGSQIHDKSIVASVVQFANTTIKETHISAENIDKVAASEAIVKALYAPDLRGIFILGSGLNTNFGSVVRELNHHVGKDVVISGGIAGDGSRFERTWIIQNGQLKQNMITAVGFYGDHIQIGYGSQGGWQPAGVPMLITKSENNTLYELNGRPALNLYKLHLGKRRNELPAAALYYPLAIRPSLTSPDYIVRTILSIDEINNSMTFAGDVPRQYFAQFMSGRQNLLIDGARKAARSSIAPHFTDATMLSIAVSCIGRRLVMGDDTTLELQTVLNNLPENTTQIGFYSYGEICAHKAGGMSDLHNQTMTLTTLSET